MGAKLTPRVFARKIGKSLGFVRKLIDAGEIQVEDVRAPGASLPRYEIDESQATAWRASRRTRLGRPPASNRAGGGLRARVTADVIT